MDLGGRTATHLTYVPCDCFQGDAFILSFWAAADAVNFCAAAQDAMLHIPWPEELLALPQCRPIWIMRT